MAYPLSRDTIITGGTTGRLDVGASIDIDAFTVLVIEEDLGTSTWAACIHVECHAMETTPTVHLSTKGLRSSSFVESNETDIRETSDGH